MTEDEPRPVGDDPGPHPVGEDADPQALAAVRRALAGLDHLRPDWAGAGEPPMPDWAWERVGSTLAAESRATQPARHSRITRWAGGLVAASVAVLAVGVGVTAFQGSGGDAVVAGGEPTGSADAALAGASADEAAKTFAEPAAPGPLSFAGMVPPVMRLVDSDTDYTSAGLGSQVEQVMDRFGVEPEAMTSADLVQAPTSVVMPTLAAAGFLSSPERLRDCITKLTEASTSTALLVDVATFEGQAASVVVAPEYAADDEPRMSELEVWVIDPECERPMRAIRLEVTP